MKSLGVERVWFGLAVRSAGRLRLRAEMGETQPSQVR